MEQEEGMREGLMKGCEKGMQERQVRGCLGRIDGERVERTGGGPGR